MRRGIIISPSFSFNLSPLFYSLSVLFFLFLFSPRSSFSAFQENLWGARPSGMGGAFTALADDANAPVYNPAGISLMSQSELTIMYAQLYSGLNLHAGQDETSKLGLGYFSYVPSIKEKKYGSYAISWTNFVATNLLREDAFSLTFADSYQLESFATKPILAYGVNLKYLRRSFTADQRSSSDPVFSGGQSKSAPTGDLGLMFRPNWDLLPGLKFGLALQNVTEPNLGLHETDRVPAKYTLGLAYQDRKFRMLNPALDISKRDGRTLLTLGWEGWMAHDTFALRAGGNSDQLGGGLGYQFKLFSQTMMRLDYSLIWPLDVEGTNGSHRVSISTNF